MPTTGKLIVIEGLEGAGKSTAINTVITLLSELNIDSITTREPGGTVVGELLRSIIKNPDYKNTLDDRSELLLLYAARTQLIEEIIKPALAKGCWVVADRFELSSFAYQGGGRGLDDAFIEQLSSFCLQGFQPDLTLFLDISPEQGMQRAQLRGQFDRIEQQSIDFFHRVHQAYMARTDSSPNMIRIDASQPLEQVQSAVRDAVCQFVESQE